MNNLNIWTIGENVEDFFEILKNVDTEANDFLLFNDCVSELVIGKKELPLYFDKMLYSMTNNLMILIMKNSELALSDIKKFFQEQNIKFFEYECNRNNYQFQNECSQNLKKIWFAFQKSELNDALIDSKLHNQDSCIYYPNVCGNLKIGYVRDGNFITFKECEINRIVDLEDKMVLVMNNSLNERQLYTAIMNTPIKTLVDVSRDVKYLEDEKAKTLMK